MRKWWALLGIYSLLSFAAVAREAAPSGVEGMGRPGDWIGGGGLGLTISPTHFLFNPQLEYVYKPNLYLGPMIQLAPGEGGVLISVGGTVRTWLGRHPRVKPTVEGGLGFAVLSSPGSTSVGVNLSGGMGMDYILNQYFTVGTMVRANFAPPMKTFYLSWPLVMVRCIL